MKDDRDILFGMGDADIGHHVLEIRFSVVMVRKVNLVLKELAEQSPYRQPLASQRLAPDEGNLF